LNQLKKLELGLVCVVFSQLKFFERYHFLQENNTNLKMLPRLRELCKGSHELTKAKTLLFITFTANLENMGKASVKRHKCNANISVILD
jgi:hypothetical protein